MNVPPVSSKTGDRFLMCRPDFFRVFYDINPWMTGQHGRINHDEAQQQWQHLQEALSQVAEVEIMAGAEPVPDLVFTANAALISGNRAILSHFRHKERQAEEPLYQAWLEAAGFDVIRLPDQLLFEGAGDALFDRGAARLWLGYGHRSSADCQAALDRLLPHQVVALELVDNRFYHLDTCLCPLPGGVLMYFPEAFSPGAQRLIRERVPQSLRIEVSQEDALGFCCNTVSAGSHIFMNAASQELEARLKDHGLVTHRIPLGQFMRAGGAAKCLTLKLNEPEPLLVAESGLTG